MSAKPDCKKLHRSCRSLDVTIVVADTDSDTRTEQDAAATWITGHQERLSFGELYRKGDSLLVDARIHVPCRFFTIDRDDSTKAGCTLHGFTGPIPKSSRPEPDQLAIDENIFSVVRKGKRRDMYLPVKKKKKKKEKKNSPKKKKALAVLNSDNPCDGAPCRTSDHKRKAACCRDLKLELLVPRKNTQLSALLQTRKSPYLCKVKRESKKLVEVEVISACGYLAPQDGITCVLHDRVRPNGKTAKPQLCYDWPDFGKDETGHPGCVFA